MKTWHTGFTQSCAIYILELNSVNVQILLLHELGANVVYFHSSNIQHPESGQGRSESYAFVENGIKGLYSCTSIHGSLMDTSLVTEALESASSI